MFLLFAFNSRTVREDGLQEAALRCREARADDNRDGRLARRLGQTSPIGMMLDHGADALFVTVLGAALARMGLLPVWLSMLIALAFIQYAVDSRLLRERGFRPSRLGRWNGIAYYVVEGVALGAAALPVPSFIALLAHGFAWFLIATTIVSMGERAAWYLRSHSRR